MTFWKLKSFLSNKTEYIPSSEAYVVPSFVNTMYLYSVSSKQKSVTLFMTFTSLLLKIIVRNMKKRNVFLVFNLIWTTASWHHDIGLHFYKKIALHFLAKASMSPTALYGFLSFLTWYNLSYSKPLASINSKYYWVTLKVILIKLSQSLLKSGIL